APATCVAPDRTPHNSLRRGTALRELDAQRPQPPQVEGGAHRCHSPRTVASPRSMQRRKPIARLISACRRKTCGTRARPNSAAGGRGRRRSAYEAPRAAADRGPRLGGAESKRRRRPRLPAPPSRVTLLMQQPGGGRRLLVGVGDHQRVGDADPELAPRARLALDRPLAAEAPSAP